MVLQAALENRFVGSIARNSHQAKAIERRAVRTRPGGFRCSGTVRKQDHIMILVHTRLTAVAILVFATNW